MLNCDRHDKKNYGLLRFLMTLLHNRESPLDQLAKDKNLTIEWKAFELRPEGIERPEKSPEYLVQAKAGIEALGQKYGLLMIFNDKSKHSRLALEGAKFAEDQGLVQRIERHTW